MIVTNSTIHPVLAALAERPILSLDCETTGLRPYHGDRLFAVVMADEKNEYYFDFNESGLDSFPLKRFFYSQPRRYILQNAKFDMHFLAQSTFQFHPKAEFYDTMVMGRLVNSDLSSYSLDFLSKYFLREAKDDAVMAFIKEYQLWAVEADGSKKLHFDRVPLAVIVPYGEKDARLTFQLYCRLQELLSFEDIRHTWPSVRNVLVNEAKLTEICFEMERAGIKIDTAYCQEALYYEERRHRGAAERFKETAGEAYKASGKLFERTLEFDRDLHPRTAKGNLRFDAETVGDLEGPAAQAVLDCKDSKSRMDYLAGFLRHRDTENFIHTNLRQSGTKTGRFASSDPNLQNLTRLEDGDEPERYPVRRAIVPDSKHHCLVMIDYSQMEYRIMLDYAAEMGLIEEILKGADVHQATADKVGISRFRAKTLNFAILFGAGAAKIGGMLDMPEDEARDLLRSYFGALPAVQTLIRSVRQTAKEKGIVFNWFGRRFHYPDANKAYSAVNHLIQGSAADVAKLAMVGCHRFLLGSKSRLALVVHDEFIFNVHVGDIHLVTELHRIIESVYPHRYLPLTATVSHSWRSLADKVSGPPVALP